MGWSQWADPSMPGTVPGGGSVQGPGTASALGGPAGFWGAPEVGAVASPAPGLVVQGEGTSEEPRRVATPQVAGTTGGAGCPSSRERPADGEALCNDITSAVSLFLSGDGDTFSESDSEVGGEEQTWSNATSQVVGGQRSRKVEVAPPPPAQPPPPPPAQKQSLLGGPLPPNLQEFLSVLRRRPLPPEVTEERRPVIYNVLTMSLQSLYRDRIKPVQSHVQRRLRERGQTEAVVQALLPLCAREPDMYRVIPPMHGEQPIILLAQEPPGFQGWVDVNAPEGDHSPEVWEAFATFLREDRDDAVALPSQPYQAALHLRQLGLPCLKDLALGEIEHLVCLALGRRRLLSHHGDALRPLRVARNTDPRDRIQKGKVDNEAPKSRVPLVTSTGAAETQKPKAPAGLPGDRGWLSDITDRDDLTVVLLQLMQKFPDGVSLSQIKHHVQAHCQHNLNEAAFKCSKLTEVFRLSPLNQIFPLEHAPNRNEIIVRPPKCTAAIPPHIWQKFYHLKATMGTGGEGAAALGGGLPPSVLSPTASAEDAGGPDHAPPLLAQTAAGVDKRSRAPGTVAQVWAG